MFYFLFFVFGKTSPTTPLLELIKLCRLPPLELIKLRRLPDYPPVELIKLRRLPPLELFSFVGFRLSSLFSRISLLKTWQVWLKLRSLFSCCQIQKWNSSCCNFLFGTSLLNGWKICVFPRFKWLFALQLYWFKLINIECNHFSK